VQLEQLPGGEPPADPPPVVARTLFEVDGNGSLVSVAAARSSQLRQPPRQPVRCGVFGVACATEVAPGSKVTVRAQPASGYAFAGWTDGCQGKSLTCTVTAGSGTVSGRFVPRRAGRAVAIRVGEPRLKASFKASVGRGTLAVSGSISASARLTIQLRRPSGGPLLSRTLRVAGPWGLRALLKRGTLIGGARLFPGAFVVSVRGAAGTIGLPLQLRTLFVKPPPEGVVRRAYASTTPTGKPLKAIPHGSRRAWAIFRFQTQPATGPLTASWYDLHGNFVGAIQKSNRPVIQTGIGAPGVIPAGTYRVDLAAGGKLIQRRKIRVR
jgi:hypothetical protein